MTIEKAPLAASKELFQIYLNAKKELDAKHIFQWTDSYPSLDIIENDLNH